MIKVRIPKNWAIINGIFLLSGALGLYFQNHAFLLLFQIIGWVAITLSIILVMWFILCIYEYDLKESEGFKQNGAWEYNRNRHVSYTVRAVFDIMILSLMIMCGYSFITVGYFVHIITTSWIYTSAIPALTKQGVIVIKE